MEGGKKLIHFSFVMGIFNFVLMKEEKLESTNEAEQDCKKSAATESGIHFSEMDESDVIS